MGEKYPKAGFTEKKKELLLANACRDVLMAQSSLPEEGFLPNTDSSLDCPIQQRRSF